jgi:hypothetical protein
MITDFSRTLKSDAPPARKREPAAAKPEPKSDLRNAAEQHQQCFAEFAANEVMPLLNKVAASAKRQSATASCRLAEENGHLAADLVIVPNHLPKGAKPPRLTIYAADGERPLMVEYTGTFPGVGATGGFGAEVNYDPIYRSQVEEKILNFVALATGG